MEAKDILVGRIYSNRNNGAFYMGVGHRVGYSSYVNKRLVVIKCTEGGYPVCLGAMVVKRKENLGLWDNFVLTDKKFLPV